MKVIVIANQKGGIGKTTTAMALSASLNHMGHKTLLIDADAQGNSSDTFRAGIEQQTTLYDVILAEDKVNIDEAIQHTENGDIVASDPLLRKADEILSGDVEGLYYLSDALANLKGYEYVVIDTAPALNIILYNCLIAANYVVIPITTDRYGIQGLVGLDQTISAVQKRQNRDLKVAGLLLVKYNDRTVLGQSGKKSIIDMATKMGTTVFDTMIRETVRVREAQGARENLMHYAPDSTAAQDYMEFTKELIRKIG